jgi:pimeloyl-ACP methyl ester carboxylesterase
MEGTEGDEEEAMTSLFKSDDARVTLLRWFERFRAQLTVPTESRTVTTRFGDTHVLIGGPAGAPALVVLHGALASSAHVLVELAPLMERFRVYSVDVIGQSVKSADTQISVANNDYGQWLADVLDGLGLASAHVLGVSWAASSRSGSRRTPPSGSIGSRCWCRRA